MFGDGIEGLASSCKCFFYLPLAAKLTTSPDETRYGPVPEGPRGGNLSIFQSQGAEVDTHRGVLMVSRS